MRKESKNKFVRERNRKVKKEAKREVSEEKKKGNRIQERRR